MNIVICGAGGMLAEDLSASFNSQGHAVTNLAFADLDITDLASARAQLQRIHPDLVVNAAAYTNVDGCESETDLAYRVNALGPRNLAIACHEQGAALVHFSTDYVFGGIGKLPYREYDPSSPKSVYGKTKLDGEIMVRSHCPRHYIIRTAWLFGLSGANFVKSMVRLAETQDVIKVVNDQIGSPTFSKDLSEAVTELIESGAFGTYHLTNEGHCTWYEFCCEILQLIGRSEVRVEPITTEELNRPADRPRYSVLDNYVWRVEGYKPLRPYKQALADYLTLAGLLKEDAI